MQPKSKEQRLFGAACLKVTLQQNGQASQGSSIYDEALIELGLSDAEVRRYLEENRERVESALVAGGAI